MGITEVENLGTMNDPWGYVYFDDDLRGIFDSGHIGYYERESMPTTQHYQQAVIVLNRMFPAFSWSPVSWFTEVRQETTQD